MTHGLATRSSVAVNRPITRTQLPVLCTEACLCEQAPSPCYASARACVYVQARISEGNAKVAIQALETLGTLFHCLRGRCR